MLKWINYIKSVDTVALAIIWIKNVLGHKATGWGRLCSVREYCQKNNCEYRIVENEKIRPVYLAGYYERSEEEIRQYAAPEIYVAKISKGNIIGRCGAIWVKGKCLLDIVAQDKENRVDYIAYPVCYQYRGRLYYRYKYKLHKNKIKKGIFLCCVAPFNYYHFLIETLSRIICMEEIVEDKEIPLLVDEMIFSYPQMEEALGKINKYHRPVIKINSEELYEVEELIYPSMNTWFPVNVKTGMRNHAKDFLISGSALINLRDAFLREVCLEEEECVWGKKIYLSRRKSEFSRLINEEKIESLFRASGFDIVYPEEMSFQEQIKLFTNAEMVAGVSGGAFANIIFCGEGTLIICIIPQECQFYLYSTMAYFLNLKYVFLDSTFVNRGENYALSQAMLEEDYCRRFLQSLTDKRI